MTRRRGEKAPLVRTAPRYPDRPPIVGSGRGVHHGGEAGPRFKAGEIEGADWQERLASYRATLKGFGLDMERDTI